MNQPCKECPFLKTSWEGYLGDLSYKPEVFLQQLDEEIMPCHLSIDWEKKEYDKAMPCAGALQFMNNHGKLSRDLAAAHIQKQYGKNEEVFEFRHEFIEHHSKKDG